MVNFERIYSAYRDSQGSDTDFLQGYLKARGFSFSTLRLEPWSIMFPRVTHATSGAGVATVIQAVDGPDASGGSRNSFFLFDWEWIIESDVSVYAAGTRKNEVRLLFDYFEPTYLRSYVGANKTVEVGAVGKDIWQKFDGAGVLCQKIRLTQTAIATSTVLQSCFKAEGLKINLN
jgi:hypothetical protein